MDNYRLAEKIKDNMNQVLVGKEHVVEQVLACLLAGGHVLLEDVPGVGKTTLALALAKSISCSFGRIQFTPDTLPSDVTGVSVYHMKTGEFSYQAGAVMNQVILADEINRTSPKTQSSLLEAMAEGQITVDGIIHRLPAPFFVIATQNPIEFAGTYPLPEAQMDRFMMRLFIGYPDRDQEILMAVQFLQGKTIEQVEAFLRNRDYVKPDDVKAVAMQVLLHRLVLSSEARVRKEEGDKGAQVHISGIVDSVSCRYQFLWRSCQLQLFLGSYPDTCDFTVFFFFHGGGAAGRQRV